MNRMIRAESDYAKSVFYITAQSAERLTLWFCYVELLIQLFSGTLNYHSTLLCNNERLPKLRVQ